MKKINVIVFGDLPIASKVCEFLINCKSDRIILAGVVIGNEKPKNNDPWDFPLLKDYAVSNNIRVYTLNEIANCDVKKLDYGIVCRYSKILKTKHINAFSKGVINFHGGLLPEFGGLYSVCHTILNGAKKGGGTLHYIDEGIDTGNILKVCSFDTTPLDTAVSIFQKTQLALYNGFIDIIDNLIDGSLKAINQKELIEKGHKYMYYDRNSLVGKKEFSLNDDPQEIDRKVRAFTFPGHEPAYFIINHEKYHVIYKNT